MLKESKVFVESPTNTRREVKLGVLDQNKGEYMTSGFSTQMTTKRNSKHEL